MSSSVPQGYLTVEEVAVAIDRSGSFVNSLARELRLQRVSFAGDNRKRFSPEDVERIKQEAAKR